MNTYQEPSSLIIRVEKNYGEEIKSYEGTT